MQCSDLHWTAVHSTSLHCTALHCTALHYVAPQFTALPCAVLHFTTLHHLAPYSLHCKVLHWTAILWLLRLAQLHCSCCKSLRRCSPCSHDSLQFCQRPIWSLNTCCAVQPGPRATGSGNWFVPLHYRHANGGQFGCIGHPNRSLFQLCNWNIRSKVQ